MPLQIFFLRNGHTQGLPRAYKNGEFLTASQACVEEVAKEHGVVLPEEGDNHGLKFTPLGFVNCNGIGQLEFDQIRFSKGGPPFIAREDNRAGQVFWVNVFNHPDITVVDSEIIVVFGLNHPVPNPKDLVADRELFFSLEIPGCWPSGEIH